MHQILFIHGGTTFRKKSDYVEFLKKRPVALEPRYSWVDDLEKKLSKKFQIIRPRMPLKENAQYADWKIYFERYIPLLKDGVTLVGVSLGGIFLAKYLSENTFPHDLKAVYLIAPPFDDSLPGEDLAGGFVLKNNLSRILTNCPNTTLLFGEHDPVVPVAHAKKYQEKLPSARIIIDPKIPGHFEMSEFPEMVALLRK